MSKPLIGVVLGAVLGVIDGLTAWFTPAVRDQLGGIVIGSTLIVWSSRDEPIRHGTFPFLKIPSKEGLVKVDGALGVARMNLEMNNSRHCLVSPYVFAAAVVRPYFCVAKPTINPTSVPGRMISK